MTILPSELMARTSECSDITKWVLVSGDIYRCTCCNWLRSYDQLLQVVK